MSWLFYLCFAPEDPTRDVADADHRRRTPQTVAETKRLVNLLTRNWHSLEHHLHLHWHTWRRRHQARARWFHHRTRQ